MDLYICTCKASNMHHILWSSLLGVKQLSCFTCYIYIYIYIYENMKNFKALIFHNNGLVWLGAKFSFDLKYNCLTQGVQIAFAVNGSYLDL